MNTIAVPEFLDVSALPRERRLITADGEISLQRTILSCQRVIHMMILEGHVKPSSSVGFAMTTVKPRFSSFAELWNDPRRLVWLVGGWGPERDGYIANAVRKLRFSVRLNLPSHAAIRNPDLVDTPVAKASEDSSHPWGDFPFGGATRVDFTVGYAFAAVSCFSQIEDVYAAQVVAGRLGQTINEAAEHDFEALNLVLNS